MYILVQAHEYHKHRDLLDQSFRLRKKVFADKLGLEGLSVRPARTRPLRRP